MDPTSRINPAQALEDIASAYNNAKQQGRVNPENQDEIEARIERLRERVNPRAKATDRWFRWGVATAAGLVITSILTGSNQANG